MDSPDEKTRVSVARDVVFLEAVEINPVVVHGGGKAITRAMEKAGLKASFVQGQRVTDEAAVKIVDEVLSREINPEVVATINTLGGGFAYPSGIAVDGSGNVFVADPGNSAVYEILAAGGYQTVNTLGRGFSEPMGVALDHGMGLQLGQR